MDSVSLGAVCAWIVLHVGALALAWGTRISLGSRVEPAMQASFFAIMAALGAAAWICRETDIEIWPASAVTLVAMVLTAVIDLRRVGDSTAARASTTTSR